MWPVWVTVSSHQHVYRCLNAVKKQHLMGIPGNTSIADCVLYTPPKILEEHGKGTSHKKYPHVRKPAAVLFSVNIWVHFAFTLLKSIRLYVKFYPAVAPHTSYDDVVFGHTKLPLLSNVSRFILNGHGININWTGPSLVITCLEISSMFSENKLTLCEISPRILMLALC